MIQQLITKVALLLTSVTLNQITDGKCKQPICPGGTGKQTEKHYRLPTISYQNVNEGAKPYGNQYKQHRFDRLCCDAEKKKSTGGFAIGSCAAH